MTNGNMEAADFVAYLNRLSDQFEQLRVARHEAGQEEYGEFTFLGNDVIRMMLEELADTANYCRMQAIKLLMLQDQLEQDDRLIGFAKNDAPAGGQVEIEIGFEAFKGTKDVGWHGRSDKDK